MNKNFYKTIFSKTRREMVVVAENVSIGGQTASAQKQCVMQMTEAVTLHHVGLTVLSFSLMLIAGTALMCGFIQNTHANIIADPTTAASQKPTILNAANGTTQINIQTPSQAGVSVNKYQQFDVNQKGAILNNSRLNTQTQLGGYISANPWLATGEAKVIVNQVSSSKSSQLNGYIEVGGRRADVIIANPAGIQVDGAGFINAGGVTLTTGNLLINQGGVAGYQIRDGLIHIAGKGLDTSTVDYTRLLSHAAQINAGIWAKELQVVTGKNDIDENNNISHIGTVSGSTNATNNTPKFAIDTGSLGGMYAGKISLISTDKGVGINNAGQIFASAGSIKISADGQLQNSGSVVTQHKEDTQQASLDIQATDLNNSGSISSLGKQSIQTTNLTNTGLIATSVELNIRNQGKIHNQGELNAGRIDLETKDLKNKSGQIVQTGLQDLAIDAKTLSNTNKGLIGYTEIDQNTGTNPSTGTGTGQTGGSGTNTEAPSTATGGGSTSVANPSITQSFAQGKIKADKIENDSGKITANGGVDLTVTESLSNAAMLNLKNFNISGKELNNQKGELNADRIQAQVNTLNNEEGVIRTNTKLDANVTELVNNKKGQISSGKDIQIHDAERNTLTIENTEDGKIIAAENLTIQAKNLNNTATITVGKDLAIALKDSFNVVAELNAGQNIDLSSTQDITNKNKIIASQNLKLSAQNIDNQKTGELISNSELKVESTSLQNRGLINSNGLTHLAVSEQIENIGTGRIYGDHVAIATKNLINAEESSATDDNTTETKAAVIAARERLDIAVHNILNREGALISSAGDIAIGGALDDNNNVEGKAEVLINSSARIEAQGNGYIGANNAQNLNKHLAVEEYLVSQKYVEKWKNPDDPNILTIGKELNQVDVGEKRSNFYYSDGRHWEISFGGHNYGMYQWQYTQSEYNERIINSKPGEIVVGGDLRISGNQWFNENSQILVGGTLSGNENQLIKNEETLANKRIEEHGQMTEYGYNGNGFFGGNEVTSTRNPYHNVVKSTTHFEQPAMVFVPQNAQVKPVVQAVNTNIPTVNADDSKIKTLDNFNTQLPSSSLFNTNPNNPEYLIETDSAFTNYKKWLGSDYMIKMFNTDPQNIHKRLGDGYYEQRLINNQIAQLTGFRRLESYQSNEDQFKALMDSGITVAKSMNLGLGIALNAEQIARLTSDIVWLINETVTLADGSQQTVLVPKVYLKVRAGDLNHAGALISANVVDLKNSQNIINQGAIAGRQIVDISAQNISNAGLIQSKVIQLTAEEQIKFEGGTAKAQNILSLSADRVELNSTTQTTGDERNGNTSLDRVAGLYITGKEGGILSVTAQNDIEIKAANISNLSDHGETQLKAIDGNVELTTLKQERNESYGQKSDKNHYLSHQSGEVGSQISSKGDISILGNNQVNIRQGTVDSEVGHVTIYGGGGVKITEGRNTRELDTSVQSKTKGLLSSKTNLNQFYNKDDEAVASVITAKAISIHSGKDLNVYGGQIISDESTTLSAVQDVNILGVENSYKNSSVHLEKKTGLMSSDGIGFSIGKKNEFTEQQSIQKTNTGSTVGSLNGNTNIIAGKNYQQTGSTVSSQNGDVNILAEQVKIEAAKEQSTSDYKHVMEQKGLTLAVNVPVVEAVKSIVNSTKQIGQSKNDRVNTMAAANTGFDAYKAGQSLGKLKDVITGAATLNQSVEVGVSLTYGEQKSVETSHIQSTTAAQSKVSAGGTVNIVATGAGKDSNINIIGSDVVGMKGTHLAADNDVNIKAAEQSSIEQSNNKSSGWNAGVTISNQTGLGVTAGGNLGKGRGDGTDTSYVNSHVGSKDSITTISSGMSSTAAQGLTGTTNLIGGQVQGKGIQIDAKELNIESLQDTATYKGKQQDISGQISIGTNGGNVSGSFNKSNVDANYVSVNEQSGIFAGDDGYQINVKNNTDLKGAIITSTQVAEDLKKNSLNTGALTKSDIQNISEYDAKGIGISGGFNSGSSKDKTKEGEKQPNTVSSSPNKTDQHASSRVGVTKSIGFGLDSDKDSSVTKSGINTSNITIRDEQAQQALTGKAAEQIKSEILTDVTTDTARENSGALKNNFDKDKVQSEINLQVDVTKQFDANRQEVRAEINKKLDEATKAKEAGTLSNTDFEKQQKKLQNLGLLVDSISAGLSSPTTSGFGIAATTVSPKLSYEIGQYFKAKESEGSTAHILAHTVLGAAVAAVGGNDALTAGLSAGGAEAAAPLLSKYLYGKDSKSLTADEKGTVSAITGLVASGVGASTGDVASTVQSGQVAQNAIENNQMTLPFPVNNQQMQSVQSLVEYGVKEGWSNDKITEVVNKEMRGKGVEISNKDVVEILDKSGKAATIVGIYPSPYTKPFAAVGGVLGTTSILIDDSKTWPQKTAEIFISNAASGASGIILKKADGISEGVKRAHNAISGEIGGKLPEAYKECKTRDVNGKKKVGC